MLSSNKCKTVTTETILNLLNQRKRFNPQMSSIWLELPFFLSMRKNMESISCYELGSSKEWAQSIPKNKVSEIELFWSKVMSLRVLSSEELLPCLLLWSTMSFKRRLVDRERPLNRILVSRGRIETVSVGWVLMSEWGPTLFWISGNCINNS